MNSIAKKVVEEIVIQKSRFIAILLPLSKEEEISLFLKDIQKEYKEATHYCYAYIFNNQKRFSDDGEPNGSAGRPILNVLERQDYNHILAVVVRYFGGIKLGIGGLYRAYTQSVTKAFEKASRISLIPGNLLRISFPYEQEKKLLSLIAPYPVLQKEYQEQVRYELFLPDSYLATLQEFSYEILQKNILGQEFKS